MKTRLGREIRATANHQFLTIHGWKRLDELQIDEHLALPRVLPVANYQQTMSDAELALPGYSQNLSHQQASGTANVIAAPELQMLAERDIYWDSIVSIEPDGEEQVYDLTVPGHHNFVANNIIVHNSLEQDADIVMFIYRPDQYEKDTVKQNVAEIIIAKHRNGPVGSVELVFRSELAKFENAATRVFRPNE